MLSADGTETGTQAGAEALPPWMDVATLWLLLAGCVVLLFAFSRWAMRGRVLEQARMNFTPWSVMDAGLILASWFLLSFGLVSVLKSIWGPETSALLIRAVDLGAGLLVVAGIGVFLRRRYGLTPVSLGLRWDCPFFSLVLAVAGLLAVAPVRGVLDAILTRFHQQARQPIVEDLRQMHGLDLVLISAAAILVAPVLEEILFRGFLQPALRNVMGSKPAILVTAGIFALAHGQPAVVLLILPLGLVLGYLYERRQSLMSPILLHAIHNGVAVAVLLVLRRGT